MPTPQPHGPAAAGFDRYIDRFLREAGWHVSDVSRRADGSGYDVTLIEPHQGRTVTRNAGSAGEATFKACSSARLLLANAAG